MLTRLLITLIAVATAALALLIVDNAVHVTIAERAAARHLLNAGP